MIYLIGVDHRIQHDGHGSANNDQRLLFSSYLEQEIARLNIQVLAEEFSDYAVRYSVASNSIVRELSYRLGLQHIFCDPDLKERDALDIPREKEMLQTLGINSLRRTDEDDLKLKKEKEKYFSIREEFWFERITEVVGKNVLMIIGAEHINTFPLVLEKYGCEYQILNRNWCFDNRSNLASKK